MKIMVVREFKFKEMKIKGKDQRVKEDGEEEEEDELGIDVGV